MEPLENDTVVSSPPRLAELKTRAIYGGGIALAALVVVWIGGWLLALLAIIAALQAWREWEGLTAHEPRYWQLIGIAYIAIPCASLIWLRDVQLAAGVHAGFTLVLFVLLAVAATDIGAYFAGKHVGGPKLAPAISPNKTWAGLGGGIGSAAVIGGICAAFMPFPETILGGIVLGALLAIVSQAGDLFESWTKRRAGVKDSGTLIPGHGGLLDRIDGYMFAVPFMALLVFLTGPAA